MKSIGRPFLGILLILILTVAGFIYYYLQASAASTAANAITFTLNEQVSRLQGQFAATNAQVATVQSQLSSANSLLATMQSQLAFANAQVSSLQRDIAGYQSQLASANAQVSSLQKDITGDQSRIASLQGDINSYKSQIASLQDQLASGQAADVAALRAQVATLQAQNQDLTAIVNLTRVATKADFVGINQLAGHQYTVASFTADYAGYITIGGQTSSPDIYITVTDSYPGYPYNDYRYPFTSGTTLTVPVLPGSITVFYNNANPNALSTGLIGVRYYY